MHDSVWKRRAAVLLGLVAGCDLDRVTVPSPPVMSASLRADEPRLGPVRSYADVPDFDMLGASLGRSAARSGGTVRPDGVAVTNVEGDPFFVYAYTMVGITKSGRRSNANVVAMSGTNVNTTIHHNVRIALTTPEGVNNFPEVVDNLSGRSLTTIVPVSGINCTTSARLSAQTTHRAGGILQGTPEIAFSLGDDSCGGGNDACEPDDEPPTQIAPGPSEPGYDSGSGGGGNGGGDCGDNPGGTNPPSSGCHDEYVYVEVSNDGGVTWITVWEGWAVVC